MVKDLDIYDKVGYGIAHDEYIPFSIKKGTLKVGKQKAPFPGQLHVEFVKVGALKCFKQFVKIKNLFCNKAFHHEKKSVLWIFSF